MSIFSKLRQAAEASARTNTEIYAAFMEKKQNGMSHGNRLEITGMLLGGGGIAEVTGRR